MEPGRRKFRVLNEMIERHVRGRKRARRRLRLEITLPEFLQRDEYVRDGFAKALRGLADEIENGQGPMAVAAHRERPFKIDWLLE